VTTSGGDGGERMFAWFATNVTEERLGVIGRSIRRIAPVIARSPGAGSTYQASVEQSESGGATSGSGHDPDSLLRWGDDPRTLSQVWAYRPPPGPD